ncbi:MAG: hypothetical protein LBD14_06400, partial [Puniceicoccales bacterium]|nr:hypothetical protein [Puniceicoccales bacterium]
VVLNERSVRDSLAHGGANRFKRAAFAVVKDVIEKGRVVLTNEAENESSYYIAAPVRIDNADDIVVVLVHKDMNTQRMYLHMVGTKESLLNRRVSGAQKERSGSSSSGVDVSTLLSEVLSVNPESVTTDVDANGEPVVSSAEAAPAAGVTPSVPATPAASPPPAASPRPGLSIPALMDILSGLVEIVRDGVDSNGLPIKHWGFMRSFETGGLEETAKGKKAKAARVSTMEESLVETARSFVRRVQHVAVMELDWHSCGIRGQPVSQLQTRCLILFILGCLVCEGGRLEACAEAEVELDAVVVVF